MYNTDASDAVHWYMSELASRVVAQTAIPDDRHHLGKLILQGFKDSPDFVLQIDGATGESETFRSALQRSVQCATAFRNIGLKTDDVIVVMAPIHIHLAIPMYAAFYTGIGVAGIDMTLTVNELKETFRCLKPSMVFCQSEKARDVQEALKEVKLESKIITFNKGESDEFCSFTELLGKHGDNTSVEDFRASDFNPAETIAFFLSTSGSTGLPKSAALTHKNLTVKIPFMCVPPKFHRTCSGKVIIALLEFIALLTDCAYYYSSSFNENGKKDAKIVLDAGNTHRVCDAIVKKIPPLLSNQNIKALHGFLAGSRKRHRITYDKFPTPVKRVIILSPIQWYSAIYNMIFAPIVRVTRIQSSETVTTEHAYYLINKYKPNVVMTSPNMLTSLLKPGEREKCDFSCFETILCGGSAPHATLLDDMRTVSPSTEIYEIYGVSEVSGIVFNFTHQQRGSCGRPLPSFKYRLVDVETMQDVTEPNIPGELWLKGPGVFKDYYNNPETTANTLTKDGWFRTGDLFKRDEQWNYFFLERIKLLLKYKNHHISPTEIEMVIKKHPGVFEVAITGVPDKEAGDLVVACVVPQEGYKLTAQDIKDIVKENLADTKHLYGGVVFLKEIPLTTNSKINRVKLASMVRQLRRD